MVLWSSYPLTAVYNPKAFILHAASLRQPCGHCGRFSTAASRRSLGSVSVPVRPTILSDRVPVIGLVGRYLTNYLIGRSLLPERKLASRGILYPSCDGTIRHYPLFPEAIPVSGVDKLRVTRPFAAQSLVSLRKPGFARLACLIHAASVRSEPGSNPSIRVLVAQNCATSFCKDSIIPAVSARHLLSLKKT